MKKKKTEVINPPQTDTELFQFTWRQVVVGLSADFFYTYLIYTEIQVRALRLACMGGGGGLAVMFVANLARI